MAIQVQMRGGTSIEHSAFTGVNREVTVDTTKKTLVVHDGVTVGGHPLATEKNLNDIKDEFNKKIENAISSEHNHDDKYSPISHFHDEYVEKGDNEGMLLKILNSYKGMLTESGSDVEYIRTTKNGLIPYQPGISSNIGTSSWRFSKGYFDTLNSTTVSTAYLKITSNIQFSDNGDKLQYDSTNGEITLFHNNSSLESTLSLGSIKLKGVEIFVGSAFPSDAKVNDILIQI